MIISNSDFFFPYIFMISFPKQLYSEYNRSLLTNEFECALLTVSDLKNVHAYQRVFDK